MCAMRPESRGHIHIQSADPRTPPAINFNFLSSPLDIQVTIAAVRIARAVMTAPAMLALQTKELAPGPDRKPCCLISGCMETAVVHGQIE